MDLTEEDAFLKGIAVMISRNKWHLRLEHGVHESEEIEDPLNVLLATGRTRAEIVDLGRKSIKEGSRVTPQESHRNDRFIEIGQTDAILFPDYNLDLWHQLDFASPQWPDESPSQMAVVPGPTLESDSCWLDSAFWLCQQMQLGHLHVDQMSYNNFRSLSPSSAMLREVMLCEVPWTLHSLKGRNIIRNDLRAALAESAIFPPIGMASVTSAVSSFVRGFPQTTWSRGKLAMCGDHVVKVRAPQWVCIIDLPKHTPDMPTLSTNLKTLGFAKTIEDAVQQVLSVKPARGKVNYTCPRVAEGSCQGPHKWLYTVLDRLAPTLLVGGPPEEQDQFSLSHLAKCELDTIITVTYTTIHEGKLLDREAKYSLYGMSVNVGAHYISLWRHKDGIYKFDDEVLTVSRCESWDSGVEEEGIIQVFVYRLEGVGGLDSTCR